MKVLVLGATGATGRLLVRQLLDRGHAVRALVRSRGRLREAVGEAEHLDVVEADLAGLSDDDWARHLDGCDGVASCLGHTMSFKGVFGPPRRLVTDAVRRVAEGVGAAALVRPAQPGRPVRFVLMNTAGNRNRGLEERVSFAQRVVLGLLRALVPPHADNEDAAEHLRAAVGADHPRLEWVVVRPDALFDAEAVADYDVHPSPTRSAIFDAGRTSRIQVAHFMAELLADDATWARWRGRMPVVYDRET